MLRIAALLAVPLLLTACQSPANNLAGSWSLDSFVDAPTAPPVPPPGQTRPTVTFEPGDATATGKVFGSGGVNRFNGTYNANGGSIAISSLGVTRMAGPTVLMRLEQVYLGALQTATTWHVAKDELLLSGAAGTVKFVRETMPAKE